MVTSRTGLTSHLNFRRRVLNRDKAAGITNCPICNVTLDYAITRKPNSAEPDHITPDAVARQLGWTIAQINAPTNGRTICRQCNQRRGAKQNTRPIKRANVQASNGW